MKTNQPDKNRDYEFWKNHEGFGLVWSNPNASDSVMIAHALRSPNLLTMANRVAAWGRGLIDPGRR